VQVLQSPPSSHLSLSLAWWPSAVVGVAINLAILTVVGIVTFGRGRRSLVRCSL
jgi:hypothetical protein